MGRNYLIFVMLAGMFGCMMNSGMSRAPAGSSRFTEVSGRASSSTAAKDSDGDSAGSSSSSDEGTVEIERSDDGHFYADVEINGASVRALIDTGATGIALSREDARSAGLATSIGMPDVVGQGADGDVRGEYVTIERIRLGHKTAESMEAIVLNAGEQSLLGQEFLSKFDSVEIRGGTMVLR